MTEQQFDRDTWGTPHYVFNWLDRRFRFDLDGCATKDNAKLSDYLGPDRDIEWMKSFLTDEIWLDLEPGFFHCSIFVNPPYSDVTPFIKQAKRLRDRGHLVVMLLNNDKSTQWYQNHIHNVANEVIDIIGGRIAFIHPVTGKEIKGNSKGQMVVVFDPTMEDFVQRSVSLDFIKKVGGFDG
ncbi:phage N-6-adenine-methyltransferase [Mannheimia sp. AT1]|uniref:Phage N-6-adenine-methyltransferase n=1 Tax=Mannheimia cairinae TaxID=3025936 RepID=A0ABT5MSQ9_9PAST|nr:phage N-6-adenine-methyltransferase [Mannheimia cairinae]MDD0824636.1 phage N-6-adenine-methyltransferase [Mannheimia cairinae]MDD0826435.1 phage N-6-adenine-methyltransferase [Mannheimia cairinae]